MALDSKVGAGGGGGHVETLQIDEIYEFSAPRFFDFIDEETEEEIRRAEFWFETSLSYAPSRMILALASSFYSLFFFFFCFTPLFVLEETLVSCIRGVVFDSSLWGVQL